LAEVDKKVQQMSTSYSYQLVRKYLKITNKAQFAKLENDLVEKLLLVNNMVSLNCFKFSSSDADKSGCIQAVLTGERKKNNG
jgi:hypothetical protein